MHLRSQLINMLAQIRQQHSSSLAQWSWLASSLLCNSGAAQATSPGRSQPGLLQQTLIMFSSNEKGRHGPHCWTCAAHLVGVG